MSENKTEENKTCESKDCKCKKLILPIVIGIIVIVGGLFFSGMLSNKADETADVAQEKPVAMYGYDPVAYRTIGYATEGKKEFEAKYKDITWLFVNAENKESFIANPEKYVPQYGGFCAIMVTQGILKPSDPKLWHIVNDKLYMNCSIDAHLKWQYDLENNIRKADFNWAKIIERKMENEKRAAIMKNDAPIKAEAPIEVKDIDKKELDSELEKDIK